MSKLIEDAQAAVTAAQAVVAELATQTPEAAPAPDNPVVSIQVTYADGATEIFSYQGSPDIPADNSAESPAADPATTQAEETPKDASEVQVQTTGGQTAGQGTIPTA